MPWTRLILATFCAGLVSSFTDWFFAGDWIHRRFTYPEIWRKDSETKAIITSSALPFVTCAAFIVLVWSFHLQSLATSLKVAALIWIIGPLPLILTNAAFIKLHRVFVILYSAGWLVKLLIAATAAHWI
jgi:hypothetical protein